MLILGSQSPRRREIMQYFTLPFEVANPPFDEDSIVYRGDPQAYTAAIANGKAATLSAQFPNSIILTADTAVHHKNAIYGKPKNIQDARRMLGELSGQWHSVYTSVTVWQKGHFYSATEKTDVLFNALTEGQICTYCDKLHLCDKAGSYQLQMAGSIAVCKIDGCYYNVIGLPINTTRQALKEATGIDLWDYLQ